MGSLMETRQIILSAQELPPIPNEYQKVEYIVTVSNSTSVLTGISGDNDNLRFVLAVSPEAYSAYRGILGNYRSETVNCWRILMAGSDDGAWLCNCNSRTGSALSIGRFRPTVVGRKFYFDITKNKRCTTCENTKVITTSTFTNADPNDREIAIGYIAENVGTSTNVPHVKWYYCKIYDDGTLIRFYVPCYRKSDGKVGFYDTVNATFNPSQGVDFALS